VTISVSTNRIEYTGNGSTAAFTFPFRVDVASHLQVFVAGVLKTITTHYTIAGIGAPGGGTVTFTAGNIPANNASIVLVRVVPVTQEVQYPVGSKFPSKTVELGLDQLTMIIQQVVEKAARTVSFITSSTSKDKTLPDPVAQTFLRWKSDLSGLENATASSITGGNLTVVTAKGDLIQGGNSGVPEALPIGAASAVLSVVAGKAAWATITDWLVALGLLSAKGDLITSTGAAVQKLAVGVDGTLLQADSTQATGLKWAATGALLPVGVVMDYFGVTAPAGWVLLSGRTIGNAASGATERANADTSALFTLLWDSIANAELPIQDSTGAPSSRGASAADDFAANKRLPVPDARGRLIAGKDDMGGTAASRLTSTGGVVGATLGAAGGAQTHTLVAAEMPAHTHTHTAPDAPISVNIQDPANNLLNHIETRTAGVATGSAGSSGAHKNVQPSLVATKIIRL
jgi:hypothetical protein